MKSYLKYDINDNIYHLIDLIQEEAQFFLHVVPQMHAWDFLQSRHSPQRTVCLMKDLEIYSPLHIIYGQ